jgi:hypothetical protein
MMGPHGVMRDIRSSGMDSGMMGSGSGPMQQGMAQHCMQMMGGMQSGGGRPNEQWRRSAPPQEER